MDARDEMLNLIRSRRDGFGLQQPEATDEGRSPDRRALASMSPLPPPEEVFVDWLLSVPHGASLEAAAREQIALIDRRASLHPDVLCLRTMLAAVAGDCGSRKQTASL